MAFRTLAQSVSCDDARRLIAAFIAGTLPRKASPVLQRHVRECEPCREVYRGGLESAGRLGAAVRREREERRREERAELREAHRRMAISASGRSKSLRGSFLRLALLPAGIVLLLTQLMRLQQPPAPLEVTWRAGLARVDDVEVTQGAPEAGARRGSWLRTEPRAALALEGAGVELELDEDSLLLVEDEALPRFRLRAGRVEVAGAAEISSVAGTIELLEGRGTIELDGRRLAVTSLGGRLVVTNALGRTTVDLANPELVVD